MPVLRRLFLAQCLAIAGVSPANGGSPNNRNWKIVEVLRFISLTILNAAGHLHTGDSRRGFPAQDIPIWPHMAGAMLVLGMVVWTAVALRKRFEKSRELSKARIMLHAIFGTQFLLGLAAYWSRLTTTDAPQPMPVMVTLTVIHTVVGAILFAFSVLVVLACYRLVPRRREVASTEPRQVTT